MTFGITLLSVFLAVVLHELGHAVAIHFTKAGKVEKFGVKILYKVLPVAYVAWDPCPKQSKKLGKRRFIVVAGILMNFLSGFFAFVTAVLFVMYFDRSVFLSNLIAPNLMFFGFVNVLFALLIALPIPLKEHDGWKFWVIKKDL